MLFKKSAYLVVINSGDYHEEISFKDENEAYLCFMHSLENPLTDQCLILKTSEKDLFNLTGKAKKLHGYTKPNPLTEEMKEAYRKHYNVGCVFG